MIFFYLIIFVGYILTFGLVRLRTVRVLVQVFMLARRGCNNHEYHNKKNPDRKWNWGVIDVMPGSNGLGILVIFENKQLVEIWRWSRRVEIRTWARRDKFVSTGFAARLLSQWVEILDSEPASSVGELTEERCRNSQYSKNCVSLSSWRKPKLKKLIKVSYLN